MIYLREVLTQSVESFEANISLYQCAYIRMNFNDFVELINPVYRVKLCEELFKVDKEKYGTDWSVIFQDKKFSYHEFFAYFAQEIYDSFEDK